MNVGRRPSELVLHGLELHDRLPELLSIARVPDGVIQRALRETDHLRADRDPSFVERLDRRAIAFSNLAEYVGARHLAALEQ